MSVYCVMVTYMPDFKLLVDSVASIRNQVERVFIIDNSLATLDFSPLDGLDNIEIHKQSQNIGIAAAQNIGIGKALDAGAEQILLSDQDTIFPPDYIGAMLKELLKHPSAAAIAPKFTDVNKTSPDGFTSLHPVFFVQFHPQSGTHKLFQAIASGKIVTAEAIKETGLMNERLFIDWVDFEWCWRARKLGFDILGNADVQIAHQLGDGSVHLGYKQLNTRSPLRHYYITRNAFYLALHSSSLDLTHRFTLFFRSFRYIVGYPLIAKPHYQNLRNVLLGAAHGFIGRLGKLDTE